MSQAPRIARTTEARIPTDLGTFQLLLFELEDDGADHLAMVMGDLAGGEGVLVRVHSACFTGEVLGSRRCDCGEQLAAALARVSAEGRGAVLYLDQEGRGIGLREKLRAYNLQDEGLDTVDANLALGHGADERDYTVAAVILRRLGVRSVRLMTNNPAKIASLEGLGIPVVERVPLEVPLTADNAPYLRAKAARLQHLLGAGGVPGRDAAGAVAPEPPEAGAA
jgi:3,4-dihydroxy 2-butanone 4-phosphate synthase/GTP cyclohydrolase II